MRLAPSRALQRDPCAIKVDDRPVSLVGADLTDRCQQFREGGGFQAVESADGGIVLFRLDHGGLAGKTKPPLRHAGTKNRLTAGRCNADFAASRLAVPHAAGMDYRWRTSFRSVRHDLSRRR